MKVRTQVLLEPRQYEGLRELAHEAGTSVSETIRRIVQAHLDGRQPLEQRMWSFVGAGADSRTDVSERHDDYLAGLDD